MRNCHNLAEKFFQETKQEWLTILKSTAFGVPFHEWLANLPELGPPPWPLL